MRLCGTSLRGQGVGRERDPGGPPLGGLSGSGGVTDWLPGSSQPSPRPAWPSLPSSLEGLCELPTPPPASELELGGCRDNLVPPGTVLPRHRDPASGERGSRPGPGPSLEGTVDKGRESSGCSLPLKRSFKIRKPKPVPQDCIVQAGGEVAMAADRSTGWLLVGEAAAHSLCADACVGSEVLAARARRETSFQRGFLGLPENPECSLSR